MDSIPHLILVPSGTVRVSWESAPDVPIALRERLRRAFSDSWEAGLVELASEEEAGLPAELRFWRLFAHASLRALARAGRQGSAVPDGAREQHVGEPDGPQSEFANLVDSAPPMPGAEYLSPAFLQTLWNTFHTWVTVAADAQGKDLEAWLRRHAPGWHMVGRVTFHLAENKGDPEFPFAFMATYVPETSANGRVLHQALSAALVEYAGQKNHARLVALLKPVQLAAERSAVVKELVESGDVFHPIAWTSAEAHRFLSDLTLLADCGLALKIPDWWRRRPRPSVAVRIGESKKKRLGTEALLDFHVGLDLNGEELTEEEWRDLMRGSDGLVRLRGQWVEVDREKLSAALNHWKAIEKASGTDGISFLKGMRLLAGTAADLGEDGFQDPERSWSAVTAGDWLAETLARLRQPSVANQKKANPHFQGQLRPYQAAGVAWLRLVTSLGLGGCLADDMGLGKTVQVLSLLADLKEGARPTGRSNSTPVLLVVPASLIANWKDEILRFTPGLRISVVHPSEPSSQGARNATGGWSRDGSKGSSKTTAIGGRGRSSDAPELVITTYGMLTRESVLRATRWRLVILDEAQAIKNPAARQTKAAKELLADARIALTGTPVENRLSDLWSLFDFLCPGLLGSSARFKAFVRSLESREHDRYAPLRKLVAPYILRRLKTDRSIISDLPDKTEVRAHCGLSKKQLGLYGRAVSDLENALTGAAGIKRKGVVLEFLMRFKQICNHPAQFLGSGSFVAKDSGKFQRLFEICREISARQEKVLVFTQFQEMTGPLSRLLAEVFSHPGCVLHGGTPVGARKKIVQEFQSEDGPQHFVLSLKAGGIGLNLTAASHVVHFDRWWNPAVENQATDRAFRIGQNRNVMIHKFVCRGTVEERIDRLIEDKVEMSNGVLKHDGGAALTELGDRELLATVALDINRAAAEL